MGKRGFTLIELLVVIAIIAILAAILFPVFSRIKEQGRKSACLQNLRQIGLGLRSYADDYDGKLPYALGWWDGAGDTFVGKAIYPFTKNMEIWQCPSNHQTDPLWRYYYNMFAEYFPNQPGVAGQPMEGPFAFAISWIRVRGRMPTQMPIVWDRRLQQQGETDFSLPHMGGWNVLYADTHAKWYRQYNRPGAGFYNDY